MTFTYRLHGLTVRSDLELAATELPDDRLAGADAAAPSGAEVRPDLTLRQLPPGAVPAEPAPGRLIAETPGADGSRFCSASATDSGVVLRFHGLCEFRFSPAVDTVGWTLHPGVSPEMAAVMAAGAMMAVALMLKGHLVLHASAVSAGDRAVAFVGRAGMGKSTLATLACTAGCRFVTDDVLRVDGGECYPGSSEARLRPSAGSLAESVRGARLRRTVDGRTGVELLPPGGDRLVLAAVVVPELIRGAEVVTAHRLPALAATVVLSRYPRVLGWRDHDTAAQQFQHLADLASTVPVWVAQVPWPPTLPTLVPDLLSAVGVGDNL